MSYSSLFGIKKDYTGEILQEYHNSWLFSPIVWQVLPDKYIPYDIMTPYGFKKGIIGFDGNEVWTKTNNKINNCDNMPDRICWELSNQQIFFTKDKECVSDCIRRFVEQNKAYDKSKEDNMSPLEMEYIIKRFNDIANDILALDENEHPYFVLKNTSVDDSVERWFYDYDENDEHIDKSLKDWNEIVAEFVVIEDGKISSFINNLDYQYNT